VTYFVVGINFEYKIAKVVEEHKNNLVVELYPEREHKKIKPIQKTLPITTIDIQDLYDKALALKLDIDVFLLGELIDSTEEKFSFRSLGEIYFSDNVSEIESIALLFALANHSELFENYQDGNFRKLNKEERAAKTLIIKKQQDAI
jgi:hypothetical protein